MKHIKWAALVLYLSTIPLANWFIENVGKQSAPYLPHTIPVGFGYEAPSGVLLIGIALFTRDFVQEQFGKKKTLLAICAGICISYLISPSLAMASTVAFALGELSDFFVYSEIKKKSLTAAVIISGVVGGVIDSLVFLKIAFNSTQFWQGQVIGKTMMALIGGCLLWSYHALSNRLHAKKI